MPILVLLGMRGVRRSRALCLFVCVSVCARVHRDVRACRAAGCCACRAERLRHRDLVQHDMCAACVFICSIASEFIRSDRLRGKKMGVASSSGPLACWHVLGENVALVLQV